MWKHQYALLAMLSFMGGSFWLLEQAPAGPWTWAAAAGALLPYGACTVGLLALEGVFGERHATSAVLVGLLGVLALGALQVAMLVGTRGASTAHWVGLVPACVGGAVYAWEIYRYLIRPAGPYPLRVCTVCTVLSRHERCPRCDFVFDEALLDDAPRGVQLERREGETHLVVRHGRRWKGWLFATASVAAMMAAWSTLLGRTPQWGQLVVLGLISAVCLVGLYAALVRALSDTRIVVRGRAVTLTREPLPWRRRGWVEPKRGRGVVWSVRRNRVDAPVDFSVALVDPDTRARTRVVGQLDCDTAQTLARRLAELV